MGEAESGISVFGAGMEQASVKEIGRRLHRDPSIISRLYSAYAADRDPNKERLLADQLER
jgi:hypothetical protein